MLLLLKNFGYILAAMGAFTWLWVLWTVFGPWFVIFLVVMIVVIVALNKVLSMGDPRC